MIFIYYILFINIKMPNNKPKWIQHKKEDFKEIYEKGGGSYGVTKGIYLMFYYSEKLNIYLSKRANDYRSFNSGENYWGYSDNDTGQEYGVEWIGDKFNKRVVLGK